MLEVKKALDSKAISEFIDLPWAIYEGDPYWVPPLKVAVNELLDIHKNPFYKHAQRVLFVAYRDGKPIGRIAGIIDQVHNDFHQEKTAFFGFFECENNKEAAKRLFHEIEVWALSQKMNTLRGPMNPSTNHECGLLVDGFLDTPTVMTTFNPPYYSELIEACGCEKSKDLLAFKLDYRSRYSERLMAQAERLKENRKVQFRSVRMGDFKNEIKKIHEIYNDAWEKNWGFVPMSFEEFAHAAKEMKFIVDPDFMLIAEVGGQPIAFALALPDINQALHKVRDGKLFPTGLLKLLWFFKGPGRRSTVNRVRIITLGVKKAYLTWGIGPMFYSEFLKRGAAKRYNGEASWILEDNLPMVKALRLMKAELTKTYRIYDKKLQ